MRWCWWRCWWRLVLPRWEDRWWCRWLRFPPPGGKFPRRNRSAGEQKCSCPGSASRRRRFVPKALSWFFFQVKTCLIAEDGVWRPARRPTSHRGAPWGVGRAPQACGCLVGPPLVFLRPIFFIYSKINLREISAHLEMCRIGISDIAFSGPEFQLPVFSLLVWILHIKREKALELLHKVFYWSKTL